MARATYKCPKCGDDVPVFGRNRRDADSLARWSLQRETLCRKCNRAEFIAQHEADVATAAADPRNTDLPALEGSAKQVAWATALRLDAIPRIEEAAKNLIDRAATIPADRLTADQVKEIQDALALVAIELRDRTEAREWIDGRDHSGGVLFSLHMRGRHNLCPSIERRMYDGLISSLRYA